MGRNYKTFFVVNKTAGGGRAGKVWEKVHKLIDREIGDTEFAYTDSQGHGMILAADALKDGYEMIVAVGGDGTINEVVNGFFEDGHPLVDNPVLGLLPAGTAGDFVRSLQFPKPFQERIKRLMGKKTRRVDIGKVKYQSLDGLDLERYFVNIAGCGLPGELVDEIRKVPRAYGGKVAYLMGLVKALRSHRNADLTLIIDNCEPIEKKSLCTVVANGQYFGSGMHIAPDAIIDDGWLDVVLIGDVGISELVRRIPQIYWGNIRNHPQVEVYRAKTLQVSAEDRVLLDMDGEQQGVLPATYSVLSKGLRLKM